MAFILGIDTGGTYTDGVVVDSVTGAILCKSKALTTKEDLTLGISECINTLEYSKLSQIGMVSLSTTLATNAVVEDQGANVGLIYLGDEINDPVPACRAVRVKGKLDIMGRIIEPLDRDEIRSVLQSWKGQVEAVAVSGYASVRNPKHEQEIKVLADQILNIPIVCAHQLTSALGFHHRTVTAVLNGRLIPVIDVLLKSVNRVLESKDIQAPLMVVKGDGTLISEDQVRQKPIETILSGPAASVNGGMALTGLREGIILDMGGTTTDIAYVAEGHGKIKREGAKIGGWRTRVRAIDISTHALGGDSLICLDRSGTVQIGPQKVWPLCMQGETYPQLGKELKNFKRRGELKSYPKYEADCYMCIEKDPPQGLTPQEKLIFESLQNEPHSLTYLARKIGADPETIDLTPLVNRNLLKRISVTPTDILHIQGRYNRWNRDLAEAGIRILAKRKGLNIIQFVRQVEKEINEKIALALLQSIADFEGQMLTMEDSAEAMYMIDRAFDKGSSSLLEPRLFIKCPIIAIGAPARAWVLNAGQLLNAQVIVPENADVANAYGAAVGKVTEKIELLIHFDRNQYILTLPWERNIYNTKEEAMFHAVHEGRKYLEHLLRDSGCSSWDIVEQLEEQHLDERKPETYVGTRLVLTGVGVSS